MYKSFFKRAFDITGAFTLLVLLFPLLIITVLTLLIYNKGSVLFKQSRPGRNEKAFLLYKFQTMKPITSSSISDTERVTPLGNLLRKTSIDELPQLFNIIKGEMSFIGPRPLLEEYLPLYSESQKKRHLVLPGITGLAQVNGRNSIDWPEKLAWDTYYVENYSFSMDLKILFKTIFRVFSGKGVNNTQNQLMEKFAGNES